jgi:hypothetical protein
MAASCSSVKGTLLARSRGIEMNLGGLAAAILRASVLQSSRVRALGIGIDEAGLGARRDLAS